jgi:FkbM family methyltransferase
MSGRIMATTPNPNVLGQLRDHVRMNRFEGRVSMHEMALSDAHADAVDFFISSCADNSGLSSLDPLWGHKATPGDAGRRVRVRIRRVDDWRVQAGVDRIDLMKIDVEGAEDRVVRGMTQTLKEAPPAHIICETTELSQTHRVLTARGYDSVVLEPVGDLANILYTHRAHG